MTEKDVLLEFSMFPVDKGESLSQYVSHSLEIIDQSGLEYKLNPMGTVIEGTWDEVMTVVDQCYERMSQDCDRITLVLKADYRKGKTGRLESKIEVVEEKLGKSLSQ